MGSLRSKTSSQAPKCKPAKSTYKDLILEAVAELNGRRGTSRQAIVKYLVHNYGINTERKLTVTKIRKSLVQLVKDGVLVQVTGRGASGSFKIAKGKVAKKAASKKPDGPQLLPKSLSVRRNKEPAKFEKEPKVSGTKTTSKKGAIAEKRNKTAFSKIDANKENVVPGKKSVATRGGARGDECSTLSPRNPATPPRRPVLGELGRNQLVDNLENANFGSLLVAWLFSK